MVTPSFETLAAIPRCFNISSGTAKFSWSGLRLGQIVSWHLSNFCSPKIIMTIILITIETLKNTLTSYVDVCQHPNSHSEVFVLSCHIACTIQVYAGGLWSQYHHVGLCVRYLNYQTFNNSFFSNVHHLLTFTVFPVSQVTVVVSLKFLLPGVGNSLVLA